MPKEPSGEIPPIQEPLELCNLALDDLGSNYMVAEDIMEELRKKHLKFSVLP